MWWFGGWGGGRDRTLLTSRKKKVKKIKNAIHTLQHPTPPQHKLTHVKSTSCCIMRCKWRLHSSSSRLISASPLGSSMWIVSFHPGVCVCVFVCSFVFVRLNSSAIDCGLRIYRFKGEGGMYCTFSRCTRDTKMGVSSPSSSSMPGRMCGGGRSGVYKNYYTTKSIQKKKQTCPWRRRRPSS